MKRALDLGGPDRDDRAAGPSVSNLVSTFLSGIGTIESQATAHLAGAFPHGSPLPPTASLPALLAAESAALAAEAAVWQRCLDKAGQSSDERDNVYYWNTSTNEVTWTKPDAVAAAAAAERAHRLVSSQAVVSKVAVKEAKVVVSKSVSKSSGGGATGFGQAKGVICISQTKGGGLVGYGSSDDSDDDSDDDDDDGGGDKDDAGDGSKPGGKGVGEVGKHVVEVEEGAEGEEEGKGEGEDEGEEEKEGQAAVAASAIACTGGQQPPLPEEEEGNNGSSTQAEAPPLPPSPPSELAPDETGDAPAAAPAQPVSAQGSDAAAGSLSQLLTDKLFALIDSWGHVHQQQTNAQTNAAAAAAAAASVSLDPKPPLAEAGGGGSTGTDHPPPVLQRIPSLRELQDLQLKHGTRTGDWCQGGLSGHYFLCRCRDLEATVAELETAGLPDSAGWKRLWDASRCRYYYGNPSSGEVTWEWPLPPLPPSGSGGVLSAPAVLYSQRDPSGEADCGGGGSGGGGSGGGTGIISSAAAVFVAAVAVAAAPEQQSVEPADSSVKATTGSKKALAADSVVAAAANGSTNKHGHGGAAGSKKRGKGVDSMMLKWQTAQAAVAQQDEADARKEARLNDPGARMADWEAKQITEGAGEFNANFMPLGSGAAPASETSRPKAATSQSWRSKVAKTRKEFTKQDI